MPVTLKLDKAILPKLPHNLLNDVMEQIRIFVENIIISSGVICLTYLYSCKGDVYDRSINESAGYCDTISDVNHVVTGQTDTCYESVYRILEHQHEDG